MSCVSNWIGSGASSVMGLVVNSSVVGKALTLKCLGYLQTHAEGREEIFFDRINRMEEDNKKQIQICL